MFYDKLIKIVQKQFHIALLCDDRRQRNVLLLVVFELLRRLIRHTVDCRRNMFEFIQHFRRFIILDVLCKLRADRCDGVFDFLNLLLLELSERLRELFPLLLVAFIEPLLMRGDKPCRQSAETARNKRVIE